MDVIMFDKLPPKVAVPVQYDPSDNTDICIVLCADHFIHQVARLGMPEKAMPYDGDQPCYICDGGEFEAERP